MTDEYRSPAEESPVKEPSVTVNALPLSLLEYIVECIKVRPVAAGDMVRQDLALRTLRHLGVL